ncbi:MAG: hypothetical protein HC828_10565 [Blastochloris sp.]|nr:hypothetical protein [Blastochloris sp.]
MAGFQRERIPAAAPVAPPVDTATRSSDPVDQAPGGSTAAHAAAPRRTPTIEDITKALLRHGMPEDMIDFMDERRIPFNKVLALLNQGRTVEEIAERIRYVPVDQPTPPDQPAPPAHAATSVPRASIAHQQPGVTVADQPNPSTARSSGTMDELIADGGLVVLAGAAWLLNGFFTAWAVVSLMPEQFVLRAIGFILGAGLHFWISRVEYAYLNKERILSPSIFPLSGCLFLDVSTTLQGMLDLVNRLFPQFLHDLPPSIFAWRPLLAAVWERLANGIRALLQTPIEPASAIPSWTSMVAVYLSIALILAVGSERFARYAYRRFQQTRGVIRTT